MRSLHVVFLSCSLQSKKCLNKPNLLYNKVRQFRQEYPDEFLATPARDLRCNLKNGSNYNSKKRNLTR